MCTYIRVPIYVCTQMYGGVEMCNHIIYAHIRTHIYKHLYIRIDDCCAYSIHARTLIQRTQTDIYIYVYT